jgi:hypothetical protein
MKVMRKMRLVFRLRPQELAKSSVRREGLLAMTGCLMLLLPMAGKKLRAIVNVIQEGNRG